MIVCHHCGHDVQLTSELQRTDGCRSCFSDLKVCMNCTFFDPGRNNQCREPAAEWCPDKTKANFCEFFQFREIAAMGRPGSGGAQVPNSRAAFDALFKKK